MTNAAKNQVNEVSPALQRKAAAVSTLRYSVRKYRDYVLQDKPMLEKIKSFFGPKEASDLEAAKANTKVTTKAIDAFVAEIENNALMQGFAVEVDGIVQPVVKKPAQELKKPLPESDFYADN